MYTYYLRSEVLPVLFFFLEREWLLGSLHRRHAFFWMVAGGPTSYLAALRKEAGSWAAGKKDDGPHDMGSWNDGRTGVELPAAA